MGHYLPTSFGQEADLWMGLNWKRLATQTEPQQQMSPETEPRREHHEHSDPAPSPWIHSAGAGRNRPDGRLQHDDRHDDHTARWHEGHLDQPQLRPHLHGHDGGRRSDLGRPRRPDRDRGRRQRDADRPADCQLQGGGDAADHGRGNGRPAHRTDRPR